MRRTILTFVAALAMVGGLAAGTTANAADDDPIIVGAAIALSGFVVPYDDTPMKGALIKIDEINEAGGLLGRPIEVVYADTKSEQSVGATAGAEVLAQGASLVIVTCDFDFGGPAALMAQNQGVVTMSLCAGDPKFGVQGIGEYAYTMGTASYAEGATLAEWAHSRGWRNAYLLKDVLIEHTKSTGESFKTRWLELDGTALVGEDTVNGMTDTSIPSQITRIKSHDDIDVIMYSGAAGAGGSAVVRQLRAAGITEPILGSVAFSGDYWLEAIPDLSDHYHVEFSSVYGDDPDEKIRAFMDKHQAKYDARPISGFVVSGYSLIEAWSRAVERAGSLDGDAVRAELDKFKDEPLLMGATTFTPDLHITKNRSFVIIEIQDGKPAAVERIRPKKVPPLVF